MQDKKQTQYQVTLESKWRMHQLYWKFLPKSECPDIWTCLPRHKWPKSWSSMEDPVVPLDRTLYCHPFAGLLRERQFEKILLNHRWENVPIWDCLFVRRQKGLCWSVYVDDMKLDGKKKHRSHVESFDETRRLRRTNIILCSHLLGVYST